MSRFKCSTEFCKRCGLDGGLCAGCEKKEAYRKGRADAIEELLDALPDCDYVGIENLVTLTEEIKKEKNGEA